MNEPSSSSLGLLTPRGSLRFLSHQNILACKKLQKIWRGYYARRILWAWGGKLTVSRVTKIQKVYRGYMGRKRAIYHLKCFHDNCANKIKGFYFVWQAKKLLRILRSDFAQRCVLKVQCKYRMKLARFRLRAARQRYHNLMALRITKVARGYLGRRRNRELCKRSTKIFREMTAIIMRDIDLVRHGTRITIETLAGDISILSEWDWLNCALFNLLGVNRRDFALDIVAELVRRFPKFTIGRFALQCILFLTWTCSGNNEHVREDYLEELIGILYHNKAQSTLEYPGNEEPIDNFIKAMPLEKICDKTSHFETTMDEIEFMYFRNAFVRHGKSAVALSSMAACTLMRLKPEYFGEDPESESNYTLRMEEIESKYVAKCLAIESAQTATTNWRRLEHLANDRVLAEKEFKDEKDQAKNLNKVHRFAIARARKLLVRSKMVNTAGMVESTSRVEVFDNIFSKPHRVVQQEDITFVRSRVLGYEAFMQLHKQTRLNFKDSMTANVEIVQCGELFIIRATLNDLPISDKEMEVIRKRNHDVQDETEMTPKWIIDYENNSKFRLKYHVRPVVLQARDVKHLSELATAWKAKDSNLSEEEVRQSGITHILSAYLLKEIRMVSCRSRLVYYREQHELCSLRLVIPAIDYKRRETNNLRTTDYSLKTIQRVYRGYRGKSRFRRLYARAKEIVRQGALMGKRRMELLTLRNERTYMASKIQARVRNFLWRRLMKKLHRSAMYIQCCFRMRHSRKIVAELRRRRDVGPEVIEMLRRGVTVGNFNFTLIIYRCGDNYRMAGHDMVNNNIYEGSLHRPEVVKLIELHNSRIKGHSSKQEKQRIYINNYYRVAELIASELGVANAISTVTTPLGAVAPGHKKLSLVAIPSAKPSINSIEKIANMNRILKDQAHVVDRYNKLLLAQQKQGESNNATSKFLK